MSTSNLCWVCWKRARVDGLYCLKCVEKIRIGEQESILLAVIDGRIILTEYRKSVEEGKEVRLGSGLSPTDTDKNV